MKRRIRAATLLTAATIGLFLTSWQAAAHAQQSDRQTDPSPSHDERVKELEARVIRLERRLEEEGTEDSGETETGDKERIAELERQVAKMQAKAEAENLEQVAASKLRIYGFMDAGFMKLFTHEDSAMNGLLPDSSSFTMTHVNLYLASQMTETLSALLELRFSFAPQGLWKYDGGFKRTDTTVIEPFSGDQFEQGGVGIERAQITWRRYELFSITVGRYLTPFGIWNTDHASTVVIPVFPPYYLVRETVPLAQTGLMLHGRLFLSSASRIDYALTVSNGRGPGDALYDVDENKGLGLKLKFTYERPDFTFSLGGYGYYGMVTDEMKQVTSLPPAGPLRIDNEVVDKHNELTGTLDLLLIIKGLRIQSEFARSLVTYEERPLRRNPLLYYDVGPNYQPDHIQWDVYVLVGYQFDAFDDKLAITPFILAERGVTDDTHPSARLWLLRGGINIMPGPFVAIKITGGTMHMPDSKDWGVKPMSFVGSQLAVSF